jgi:glycosyltransferase involved in cell wall biosynthesis
VHIHHLAQSLFPGDAMGSAMVDFAGLARRLGFFGEIYAEDLSPELAAMARPARALRPEREDLVLYHHGIASPLVSRLLSFRCRKALVYHNITPSRFYRGTRLAEFLDQGRAQVRSLAGRVDVALGVSAFNAKELEAAGHPSPFVVPLPVDPGRFADPQVPRTRDLEVLAVGRIVPHKRVDDLIEVYAALLRIRPDARLTVVGGFDAGSRFFRSLQGLVKRLPGVRFAGKVSHEDLVRHYRRARVLVSMSEHEGFAVPLVEAMICDLPVIARASGAVPDTLGGAGIAFDAATPAEVASLIAVVDEDTMLRESILTGQRRRAADFSPARAAVALEVALDRVLPRRQRVRPVRDRPRVAFVVQRFGDVVGGAERHCQLVAERMARHWDIEVLTTCARDFLTWANEWPEGDSKSGGFTVRRFPVRRPRNMAAFNGLSGRMFGHIQDRVAEEKWLAQQGPVAPGLLSHLAQSLYDGYVFFTYLYAPTVHGLPLCHERAILVPTAHDEPAIRFRIYQEVFESPCELFCNSPEEAALIGRLFPKPAARRIVGLGVEVLPGDGDRFRQRRQLPNPYVLYLGRIDSRKGCPELLTAYARLRRSNPNPPTLVMAGHASIPVGGMGVVHVGRLDEQEKNDALAGALAVIVPSPMESLSIVTLEAMAHGRPAIVNADCQVLAGHVSRSGAGVTYRGAAGLAAAIDRARTEGDAMGRLGRDYVESRYTWARVEEAYLSAAARYFGARKAMAAGSEGAA